MDFDVEEVGLEDWNMRTIDVPDVCDPAIVCDKVFRCGSYFFLLQNVGKLNNVVIFSEGVDGRPLECVRAIANFFRYLCDNKIADSVFIIGGQHHRTYDALYRFFDKGDVVRENIGYFVSLTGTKWRQFCTK